MIRLAALLLLVGCVPAEVPATTHPDVFYVGDSLCAQTFDTWGKTAQEIAGIQTRCVGGRKLMDIKGLPDGRIVFLGLVTNDCNRTPIDDYRYKLQTMLLTTDAKVYCVLPTNLIRGESCAAWGQVMTEECTDTINPHDYGVLPRAKDGYHWNPVDHRNFSRAIIERI
jgi:hypothetical protein